MSGKAQQAAAAMKNGQQAQVKKVRGFNKFIRPTTVALPKKPLYEHKAVQPVAVKRNEYKIIVAPVTSDKANRKLEEQNTMTFWVDIRATKTEIKNAFNKLYGTKPEKVCTLINAKGLKKAYIRLPATTEAMNIASEIGFA